MSHNTLSTGTILNERYEIEHLLGMGGFGATYKAIDQKLDMAVAVKEYFESDEASRKKQLREAKIMARFAKESNIVNVRDFFEENEKAYIVMEYLEGCTLKDYLNAKGRLSYKETLELMLPVMNVLEKIHEAGSIHRDVSPDNIMLIEGKKVKLLDFGAMRDYDGEEQKTASVVLKPGYAPVEQYQGKRYQGPWMDVYALCGVMYKCLTGKTPDESLSRLFADEMLWPSELGISLPESVEDILKEGLAVKYDERISSIGELKSRLMPKKASENDSVEEDDSVPAWIREAMGTEHKIPEKKAVSERKIPEKKAAEERKVPEKKAAAERKEPEKKRHLRKQKEEVVKERSKKNASGSKQKKAGTILGIIGAAAIAIVAGTLILDNPYQFEDSHIATIKEEKITTAQLKKIKRDSDVSDLHFYRCELDNDIFEYIADMKYICEIELNDCTGFTSLGALADMEQLEYISIDLDTINGEQMFDGDFSHLKRLGFTVGEFVGGMEFLNGFTSLEQLYFIGDPKGLDNIEFFQYMPNMADVDIYGGENVNLSGDRTWPLSHCTNITDLRLESAGVDDISFAEGMTKLSSLQLQGCNVTDITALANCVEMRTLNLNDNEVSNIDALSGMTLMMYLKLNNNPISDISAIGNMPKLLELSLANGQVSDLSPLEGLTLLSSVEMPNNQITSIDPLRTAVKMVSLDVTNNQVTNLNACEGMIQLEYLKAGNNQINNIDKLYSAILKKVHLQNNQISDISVFDGRCKELKAIDLSNNQISSLSPLSGAEKLYGIVVDHNYLTSLNGLENKAVLQGISAYNNQISDITALASSTQVAFLDLGKNLIQDVTPLAGMTSSNVALLLEYNHISDISMLPPNLKYRIISVYGNPIRDFAIVASMKNINPLYDQFYFSHNEGIDYAQIGQITFENGAYAIGVPAEQQGSVYAIMKEQKTNSFDSVAQFITAEEADAKLQEYRDTKADLLNK